MLNEQHKAYWTVTYPTPRSHILITSLETTADIVEYDHKQPIRGQLIHAITGKVVNENIVITPSEHSRIYFVRSRKGYFYVCKWYAHVQGYTCSCYECKKHGYCEHVGQLEDHLGIVAA
jgi:hypothetical protein